MNANTSLVLVAIVGIIVPILTLLVKFIQDRGIARDARAAATAAGAKVAEVRADLVASSAITDRKLEQIHLLVNSRLTKLLEINEELRALLREWAPNDPRVRALDQTPP